VNNEKIPDALEWCSDFVFSFVGVDACGVLFTSLVLAGLGLDGLELGLGLELGRGLGLVAECGLGLGLEPCLVGNVLYLVGVELLLLLLLLYL